MKVELILSIISLTVTVYFCLVKARRERPQLQFCQVTPYRPMLRADPDHPGKKRLCIQPRGESAVICVNHSERPNSIYAFDCYLQLDSGELRGEQGYVGEVGLPWNLGPEASLAFGPAFFFLVDEGFEVSDDFRVRARFHTASGRSFEQLIRADTSSDTVMSQHRRS